MRKGTDYLVYSFAEAQFIEVRLNLERLGEVTVALVVLD